MSFKFKSNKKQVQQQMNKANINMLEAIGKAAEGYVKLDTPVGQYPTGSGRVGGALRDSINYKVDKDGVYVGSTLTSEDYPIYVEKGTSKMAAQPYISSGVMSNLAALRVIAERNYKL